MCFGAKRARCAAEIIALTCAYTVHAQVITFFIASREDRDRKEIALFTLAG